MIADVWLEECPYGDETGYDGHGGRTHALHDLRPTGQVLGFVVCNQCRVVFVPARPNPRRPD